MMSKLRVERNHTGANRASPLLSTVMRSMLLLALLQILVFAIMLTVNQGFSYMERYSYSLLVEKTENRKSYVENALNQKTNMVLETAVRVGAKAEALMEERGATGLTCQTDKELNRLLLEESAEDLIELIRRGTVNDAFVLLNSGTLYDKGEQKLVTGLYLRDTDVEENSISDNKDIFMEMGSSEVARRYGLALDFEWSLYLDMTNQEKFDFFTKPIETYSQKPDTPLYSLGYWSGVSGISKSQQGSVKYTLPLADGNGNVYGVLGVGLLEKTIDQIMPNTDFLIDGTCYILGVSQDGTGRYQPVLYRGTVYNRLVSDNTVLSRAREAGYSLYDFTTEDDPGILGSIQDMNLYSSQSPYRNEKWAMISVADRDLILGAYHSLIRTFIISALIALATSAAFALLISRRLSRPVTRMVSQLDGSHGSYAPLEFRSSKIKEIDRLADSISDLQADINEYASRVSRIISAAGGKIGVFMYSCTARTVFVGESLIKLLHFEGLPEADVTISMEEFQKQLQCVDPEQTILTMPIFKEGADQSASVSRELKYITADDSTLWYRFSLARDKDNVMGLVQDITDTTAKLLEANAALKIACAAAEQASYTKTDFLSRMSHDIRTPMNAIISLTAIARNNLNNREKVTDCFNKISTSSHYLLSLINDVLDMSKIEAGKFVLAEEKINLRELTNGFLEMIRPSVKAKDHTLTVEIGKLTHEHVISDSLRIQQVFMNIMSNAIKYTPKGGQIYFSLKEKPTGKEKTGCFEFVFSDNGKGMSQEFLEKLFTPFEREEDLRVAKEQGTGLGMAIANSLVTMLNGNIQVRSAPDKGTTFTVTLFLHLDDTVMETQAGLKGIRALVVAGDDGEREQVCAMLRSAGMECGEASTGEEAETMAAAAVSEGEAFRVAVIDWALPDMDGGQTTKGICRGTEAHRPAIICVYDGQNGVEPVVKETGADTFLTKPLDKSNLLSAIRFLLEREPTDALRSLQDEDFSAYRVLLVEDNELNTEIACEILGTTGMQIETAENGQEAVEKFEASPPGYFDLIFMDIQMPVMNGYEATQTIRRLPRPDAGAVPIVAMTANAFVEDVRNAERAGMNGHIAKPLDLDKLHEILIQWLHKVPTS